MTYEEELDMRHKFLMSCLKAKEVGDECAKQYRALIAERLQRLAEAERDNGVTICTPQPHVPAVVEVDIVNHLAKMCSKPKVAKSQSIQKATMDMLVAIQVGFTADVMTPTGSTADVMTPATSTVDNMTPDEARKKLDEKNLVKLATRTLPAEVTRKVKFVTVEFAGVKFKTCAVSGTEYLQYVEKNIIGRLIGLFPAAEHVIVSEEKYTFTPDNFKAATRAQRQQQKEDVYRPPENSRRDVEQGDIQQRVSRLYK